MIPTHSGDASLPPAPLPTDSGATPKPFYRHIYFWVLAGVILGELKKIEGYSAAAKQQNAVDFILHAIPKTAVSAFTEGEILQVLLVSVLVGVALAKMGPRAQPLVHAIHLVSQAFFSVVGFVVRLASETATPRAEARLRPAG